MGWATGDDVVAVTGEEATGKAVALANVFIDIFGGTTQEAADAGLISSRNLRYLKQATAFQAVWLDAHPDVLETMDVEGVSQDGLNATYANVNAHLLAPMASRCLNRLSWRAQITARRSARMASTDRGTRDSAVRDDAYEWTPMPFGSTPGGH